MKIIDLISLRRISLIFSSKTVAVFVAIFFCLLASWAIVAPYPAFCTASIMLWLSVFWLSISNVSVFVRRLTLILLVPLIFFTAFST